MSSAIFSFISPLSKSHPFPGCRSLNVFHDYILSFIFGKFPFLFFFPYYGWRTTPSRKPINPLNVVPRTSAKSVRRGWCEGKCEESRREEPRPVKFPGKVISRLRWPINMGKCRYAHSCLERILR